MIVAWIVYGLLIGSLLAAAAWCLDEICRLSARSTRWVWVGALVLTVILTGVAPYRATPPARPVAAYPIPVASNAVKTMPVGRHSDQTPRSNGWFRQLRAIHRVLTAPMQQAISASTHVPVPLHSYLAALWLALSALVLGWFAAVHWRFHRVRRHWPVARLHGIRIRVAPDAGPLVAGVYRPEIVVPQALFACCSSEQRLVLTHEGEHIRARDPLLLTVAWATAVLFPWHPAVWWMLSRLRLAVEIDCDVRVLCHGGTPELYGTLLINLAGGDAGLPAGVTALAAAPSHLHRRLLAMTPRRPRFARTRTGTLAASAILIVGLVLTLPASAFAQTPLARLVGTWIGHLPGDPGTGLRVRFIMRADSTFAMDYVTRTGGSAETMIFTSPSPRRNETASQTGLTGRVVRSVGDTLAIVLQFEDPDTHKLVDAPNTPELLFVVALEDQKLTIFDQGFLGPEPLSFKRADP